MSLTALFFLLGFAAGSIAALVRHPVFGLLTYVGVFYLHPPSRWWGQGSLADFRWAFIAAAVTLAAMLIHKPQRPTTPISKSGLFWGFLALVAWVGVQSLWALDTEAHSYLLVLYIKFALVMLMISRCIETEQHLTWFLWAHVTGCFYLGWLAFVSHTGGRLDGVGGPGISEANAAALQIVTGVIVGASLFLAGSTRARVALFGMFPVMLNALVATISRSAFLSASAGGFIYMFLAPRRYRARVFGLSVLALALFLMLTNQNYWDRISTIKYRGADVEGVDTGGGRLEIIQAQWQMFASRPLGCGHWCTEVLSPSYIDERFLGYGVARASHNTFMTMLVDHGVPGGTIYLAMLIWIYRQFRETRRVLREREGLLMATLTAIVAALGAITIGDLFVQYPRLEVRIWFLTLIPVLMHLAQLSVAPEPSLVAKE